MFQTDHFIGLVRFRVPVQAMWGVLATLSAFIIIVMVVQRCLEAAVYVAALCIKKREQCVGVAVGHVPFCRVQSGLT